MPVTITDIAKRLGISHPVVSKVLHGGKSNVGVSQKTRARIESAAQEMGYRAHAAGQSLKSRRFNTIGVVIGSQDPNFHLPASTINSLSRGLAVHDHTCTFVSVTGLGQQELMACPLVKRRQVDALIVSYAHQPPDDMIQALQDVSLPIIWLHHGARHNIIRTDEAGACRMLVDHLAQQGHDRIMFIDYSTGLDDPASLERLEAFETRCHGLHIDPILMASRKVPREDRFDAVSSWITRKSAPRAVIANSLSTAIAVLQAAVHLGIKVPDDMAIATFDDGFHYNLAIPTLTAAIAPHAALGDAAASLAIRLSQDPTLRVEPTVLPFELRVGGSTLGSNPPKGRA